MANVYSTVDNNSCVYMPKKILYNAVPVLTGTRIKIRHSSIKRCKSKLSSICTALNANRGCSTSRRKQIWTKIFTVLCYSFVHSKLSKLKRIFIRRIMRLVRIRMYILHSNVGLKSYHKHARPLKARSRTTRAHGVAQQVNNVSHNSIVNNEKKSRIRNAQKTKDTAYSSRATFYERCIMYINSLAHNGKRQYKNANKRAQLRNSNYAINAEAASLAEYTSYSDNKIRTRSLQLYKVRDAITRRKLGDTHKRYSVRVSTPSRHIVRRNTSSVNVFNSLVKKQRSNLLSLGTINKKRCMLQFCRNNLLRFHMQFTKVNNLRKKDRALARTCMRKINNSVLRNSALFTPFFKQIRSRCGTPYNVLNKHAIIYRSIVNLLRISTTRISRTNAVRIHRSMYSYSVKPQKAHVFAVAKLVRQRYWAQRDSCEVIQISKYRGESIKLFFAKRIRKFCYKLAAAIKRSSVTATFSTQSVLLLLLLYLKTLTNTQIRNIRITNKVLRRFSARLLQRNDTLRNSLFSLQIRLHAIMKNKKRY